MKIKVAMLDHDSNYLSRIASVFMSKFSDKIEVYSFTDSDVAVSNLKKSRINVFIASDSFDIDVSLLPKHCGLCYLVDSQNVETHKDRPAIFKYQKPEMIFKVILDIFSGMSGIGGPRPGSNSNVRIITFSSASGGVGSSSVAVACAKGFASAGNKTLYLNLEQFGSVESFFSGAGQMNFSDVIFALKSRKANLFLKLESAIKQDASGVFFYGSSNTVLDMMELKADDVQRLMSDLRLAGTYDVIIVDIDLTLNTTNLVIFRDSENIVFVSDGSETSNVKFQRMYRALELLDERSEMPFIPRIAIFYNKFSSKTGKTLDYGLNEIGGAPKYENASTEQVVAQLTGMNIFQKL